MVNKPGPLPQPKKRQKFSVRQKKLLKELGTSKTITEAAIKAGYPAKNAGQSGSQALKAMRGRVPDLMDRVGLTEEHLIEKHLKPLLEANEVKFVREVAEVKRGRRTIQLPVVKQYLVSDNATRLNALDKSFLLHGSYAPRDPKEAAQFGVKVIVQDLGLLRGANGRPPIDIKPGQPVPELRVGVEVKSGKNGSKNGHGDD